MILDRTGQALGIKTIKVNNKDITIKTNVGDVRKYLIDISKAKENNNSEAIINIQFDFIEKLLIQGNPKEDKIEIKADVEEYFQELIKEVTIALRLAKKEDYETKEELKN